jgi:hypothetical protein
MPMSMLLSRQPPVPQSQVFHRTPRRLAWASLALTMSVPLAYAGCGRLDDADEYRQGVPHHEDIDIVVPGGEAQTSALHADGVSETRAALLGEQAELYKLTRGITANVNLATASVLGLVRTIMGFPPSSVDAQEGVAVWGPHTEALSPNTWRLTVHRVERGSFQYLFEAKAKTADDSAYLTILSGHHMAATPGLRRRANLPAYGSGDFDLDWDNAQMLPEHDADNVGSAHFIYSRPAPGSDVNVAVAFHQVLDKETNMRVDAQYGYVETPAAGGSFQFTMTKNQIPTTAALETLAVRSRWQQSGAGRSDVRMTGGDLATPATANECWDSNFGSVFMTNSYGDAAKTWGAETSCDAAFQTPDYAVF